MYILNLTMIDQKNEVNKEKREVDLYFVNCLNREDWLSNFFFFFLPETIDGIYFIFLLIIVDFFTEDYVDDPIFLPLPLLTGIIRII